MIFVKANRKSANCKLIYTDEPGEPICDLLSINNVELQIIKELLEKYNLNNKNIKIVTQGGGFVSKKEVYKLAIAKLIVKINSTNKEKLVKEYPKILRSDPRRKLPKKAGCYGARAKRQKSYR